MLIYKLSHYHVVELYRSFYTVLLNATDGKILLLPFRRQDDGQ